MRIGMIGNGKLGCPVAVAMDSRGHDVMCYDINPDNMQKDRWPNIEAGLNGEPLFEKSLRASGLRFGSVKQVVTHADIIFVAVQTPHGPEYEGINVLPETRQDFDYSYLRSAVYEVCRHVESQKKNVVLAVISTVLPGTIRRDVLPLCSPGVMLAYSPSLIAMGTTIKDFLYPEFTILGSDSSNAITILKSFYQTVHSAPITDLTFEEAELVKILYNLFIGQKITFANTLMEISHKIGNANCDKVTEVLGMAHKRLISTAYMRGGMGDAGSCHPRDAIAMSWLARQLELSNDIFESVMLTRERQARWLCDLLVSENLPMCILGKAYKPETNLAFGSCAMLCRNLIVGEFELACDILDPYIDGQPAVLDKISKMPPTAFLLATNHRFWKNITHALPAGSVILDPWGEYPDVDGVRVVRIGRGQ